MDEATRAKIDSVRRKNYFFGDYHLSVTQTEMGINIDVQIDPDAKGGRIAVQKEVNFNTLKTEPARILFPAFAMRKPDEISGLVDWLGVAQSIGLSLDKLISNREDFKWPIVVKVIRGKLEADFEE